MFLLKVVWAAEESWLAIVFTARVVVTVKDVFVDVGVVCTAFKKTYYNMNSPLNIFLESFIIKMMQIWLNKYVKEDFINHLVLFLEINNATTLVNNSLWRAINNTCLKVISCVSFCASIHISICLVQTYPMVTWRWTACEKKKIVYRKINRCKQNPSCFNSYVFLYLIFSNFCLGLFSLKQNV